MNNTPARQIQPFTAAALHRGSASPSLSGRAVVSAWGISVAVHILLFVVMLGLAFPFTPDSAMSKQPEAFTAIVGPVDATSIKPSPKPQILERAPLLEVREGRPTPMSFTDVADLTRIKRPELTIVGIGAGGGDAADYRIPMEMGGGSPEFFGLREETPGVRSVVYVVDRSGSMQVIFPFVQRELKRSIDMLHRSQKFHVIFFSEGAPLESPPRRLVNAVRAHKEAANKFIDGMGTQGDTQPQWALRRALSLEPTIIYLFSDGDEFPKDLLKRLEEWNAERRTRLFTVGFTDGPPSSEASRILGAIAREHNGDFRLISEDDLFLED